MVMRVVMVTLSTVVDVDRGNPTPAHAGGGASTGDDVGWWGPVRARHVHPMHIRHGKSELSTSLLTSIFHDGPVWGWSAPVASRLF